MPEEEKTLIIKFGGKAVEKPECFPKIADLILRRAQSYARIVCVVSAMQGMTDELINLSHKVHPNPPRREYDMLVSTGERISIALLAMALSLKGREAISFTGSQSGIITNEDHSEALIIDVRPERIRAALMSGKIAIVAGFQGVSRSKEITTLGRGGSDTSAVALGVALRAEKVEFYKDVLGIYDRDPKVEKEALLHRKLSYDEAAEIVERSLKKVLHPRAIKLAKVNQLPLHLLSFQAQDAGTEITACDARACQITYEG